MAFPQCGFRLMLNRDIYVLFTPMLVVLGANAHAETPVFLDQQFSSRPVEEPADVRFVQTKCPPIAKEIVVCAQVKQDDSPYRCLYKTRVGIPMVPLRVWLVSGLG
jgi:hypothetical protein